MSVKDNNATLAAVTVFSSGSTTSITTLNNAISAVQDPTSSAYGGTGSQPGYPYGRFTFSGTFGTPPAAGMALQIFFRLPADGTISGTVTTWGTDLGRSTNPVEPMKATIPLDSANTAQARSSQKIVIPAVPFEVIMVNPTAYTIASGWSLTFVPETDAGV